MNKNQNKSSRSLSNFNNEICNTRLSDPFYSKAHLSMLEQRVFEIKAMKNCHEHELIESSNQSK